MEAGKLIVLLSVLIMSGCNSVPSPKPPVSTGIFKGRPGQQPSEETVVITCDPIIDFQNWTANLTTGSISLPFKQIGTTFQLTLPNLNNSETIAREASQLLESLDNAQVMYCKGLLLVSPEDRFKVLQDYNTLVITLTTLLRNLSLSKNDADAQAAISQAAAIALPSTSAANQPPKPASTTPSASTISTTAKTPEAATSGAAEVSGRSGTKTLTGDVTVNGINVTFGEGKSEINTGSVPIKTTSTAAPALLKLQVNSAADTSPEAAVSHISGAAAQVSATIQQVLGEHSNMR